MMKRYRIARIEGRWTNFVPPIQGGAFCKTPTEPSSSATDGGITSSNATPLSRTPSPLFDQSSSHSELRRRPNDQQRDHDGSLDDALDGMVYLDMQTREQINLDLDRYPAVDTCTQQVIVDKYRALNEEIKRRGLYQCDYRAYAVELFRYSLMFGAFWILLLRGHYALSGFFLAIFWQQLVFTAHDAGHLGITHNLHIDSVIGIFIADFLGGLSLTWWKRNHNVHHIVTNSPEHDPDIEHMPFFAVSHRLLSNLRSTYYDKVMEYDAAAKFFISLQAWLYYPVMGLARFNLYRLSWDHLLARRGPQKGVTWWYWWLEMTGQVCFWIWFGYGVMYSFIPTNTDRFVFIMVSHTVSAILHIQITLSHFAMSTADLGPQESFPQRMLRTTMDVDCPQWLDFFHGGLQFQAVHHLFPRIPRHNLREAQKLVQEFCADTGIPYALYGFAKGNGRVIGKLAEVSRQAAILAECQRSMMAKGFFAH